MEVKKDTSSGVAGKASIPGTGKCMSLYLHVENLPVSGLAQLPEILLALFPLSPAASSVCPWQNRRCGPVPGQIGNGEWHDPLIPSLPAMLRNASFRIPELGSRQGSGGGPNPSPCRRSGRPRGGEGRAVWGRLVDQGQDGVLSCFPTY